MADEATFGADPQVSVSGRTGTVVLLGGTISTVAALALVYVLNEHGENVMGWYADYVLPIGAVLVGLVASSGFGVASWFSGTKISGRLLVLVVALLAGGYFLAEYLEFRLRFPGGAIGPTGEAIGFWDYFDFMSRSFAFEDKSMHEPGSPMGIWGYAFRALEFAGFCFGGILIPLALSKKPYCESCQAYKRTRALGHIAASVPARRISKKNIQEVEAQNQANATALEAGRATLGAIQTAGSAGDTAALNGALASAFDSSAKKLPLRIVVSLIHCRRCFDGALDAAFLSGQGKRLRRTQLARTPIAKPVVSQLALRT